MGLSAPPINPKYGTRANRPAANAVPPKTIYVSTDIHGGHADISDGTTWWPFGQFEDSGWQGLYLVDDFARYPEGVWLSPQTMDNNLQWSVSWPTIAPIPATTDLKIQDGKLRLDAAGADYIYSPLIIEPDYISIEFELTAGTAGTSGLACIVSSQIALGAPSPGLSAAQQSCHLVTGPTTTNISFYENDAGGGHPADWSHQHSPNLIAGKKYRLQMYRIAPDKIFIICPDGFSAVVQDRRIQTNWGRMVVIEHYQVLNYGTEMRALFHRYVAGRMGIRSGGLETPALAGGIPGCIFVPPNTLGGTLLALTANRAYYSPFFVSDPVSLATAFAEITTAGAAGTKLTASIYVADQNWQPKKLFLNLGEIAVDAIGVLQFPAFTATKLPRGRYVVRWHSSGAPTLRYLSYQLREAPNVRASVLTATPFMNHVYAALAYTNAPEDPGTAWNSYITSALCGWYTPIALTWTGTD